MCNLIKRLLLIITFVNYYCYNNHFASVLSHVLRQIAWILNWKRTRAKSLIIFNDACFDNHIQSHVNVHEILISNRYLSTGFRTHAHSWIVSQRISKDASISVWLLKHTTRKVESIAIRRHSYELIKTWTRAVFSALCFCVVGVLIPRDECVLLVLRFRIVSERERDSWIEIVSRAAVRSLPETLEAACSCTYSRVWGLTPSNRKRTIILSSSRINEIDRRRHREPVAKRIPMKMLQSLNALAGKISPGSPTDSNANKVHMHNNNNNNNNVVHHHPYSKQQTQPSPSHSANGDQKENTWVFFCYFYTAKCVGCFF